MVFEQNLAHIAIVDKIEKLISGSAPSIRKYIEKNGKQKISLIYLFSSL